MEGALEDQDERREASVESCAAVVDTRLCTSAGEIPDAVITQGECEKLDPDGLAYYADEQQARRDQQQLLAASNASEERCNGIDNGCGAANEPANERRE
jgi:hypothetical protein